MDWLVIFNMLATRHTCVLWPRRATGP